MAKEGFIKTWLRDWWDIFCHELKQIFSDPPDSTAVLYNYEPLIFFCKLYKISIIKRLDKAEGINIRIAALKYYGTYSLLDFGIHAACADCKNLFFAGKQLLFRNIFYVSSNFC